MPATRALSSLRRCHFRYHYAALTHFSALAPLLVGAALAMLGVRVAIAVFLLGNATLVSVLPRSRAFRKSADERMAQRAAVRLREGVLRRMSAVHVGELDRLEGLAAAIRRHCKRAGATSNEAPDATVERWLGLDKLLALYAELAITHHVNAKAFGPDDRAALEREGEEVKTLEFGLDRSSDPWVERRRAIQRRREEAWARAIHERNLVLHALATIGGVIRWMHELCAVATGESARGQVEDLLACWESSGMTLREVSSLRHADTPAVDPGALALGREVLARNAVLAFGPGGPPLPATGRAPAPTTLPGAERIAPLDHDGGQRPARAAERREHPSTVVHC